MYSVNSAVTLTDAAFRGNWASEDGGGMLNNSSELTLTNVVFSGNAAQDDGGGMLNWEYSSVVLTNASFNGNLAHDRGGSIYNIDSDTVIHNSILWGNGGGQIANDLGTYTISYSDIQGWGGGGTGNLDVDPQFVTEIDASTAPSTAGDLRLKPGSLVVNAGDNSLLPPGIAVDLDGNPRIALGIVDMGAYEVQPHARLYLPILLKGLGP
jgi:hypothetical protein